MAKWKYQSYTEEFRRDTELLHKDPQWPLRVGLQFTLNGMELTIQGQTELPFG